MIKGFRHLRQLIRTDGEIKINMMHLLMREYGLDTASLYVRAIQNRALKCGCILVNRYPAYTTFRKPCYANSTMLTEDEILARGYVKEGDFYARYNF